MKTAIETEAAALLEKRLKDISARIQVAETQAGRHSGSTTLLAASKAQSVAAIRAAHKLGLQAIGENYVAEALEKQRLLSDLPLTWHFIGALQSNKAAQVAQHFDWVQSVDRFKIAERLSRYRPLDAPPLNICVQVNIDQEPQKAGVLPTDTLALCKQVQELPRLRLRGLMAIPKANQPPPALKQSFLSLAALQKRIAKDLQPEMFDVLSMGMSADFELAIACGSTLIRLGTAIFGQRTA